MTKSLHLPSPSRDQIVAAIYETVLRPELFDRFSPQQQTDQNAPPAASPAEVSPVFKAPELQAHFARALEILEQRWVQLGRPDPLNALSREDSYDQTEGVVIGNRHWLVLDHSGGLLNGSRQALLDIGMSDMDVSDGGARGREKQEKPVTELSADLQLTAASERRWSDFRECVAAGRFSWRDVLVLATSKVDRKLICRPILIGVGQMEVAISVEALDVVWHTGAEKMIAQTFGLEIFEILLLRELVTGRSQKGRRKSEVSAGCADFPVGGDALSLIAAKAGAPGVAELIRLVGFLMHEQASDQAIAEGRALPSSRLIYDQDGSPTQVFRLGSETGQPVIFLHGMMDGIAGIQRMQLQLRTCGFRVYAPLRGGYGASGSAPKHGSQLSACIAQIETLIEQEKLQRPILLGHRSGVVYARAVALSLRERIGGIVGVSPTPPLKQARDYRTLSGYQRGLTFCARFAPALLPLALKSWSRSMLRRGAGSLVRRQAKPGTRAQVQLNKLELDPLLCQSQAMMMKQDGAGFLADLLLATSDWRKDIVGPSGAAIYLCGDDQPSVRQDGLYPVMSGMEKVQTRVCSGTGSVLLYVGPELVLAALEEMSSGR
ncbi:Alpha/beta hydrolase family protein [Phaeobacter sp. CECT 5382]|nr:Alpha/beta hydrolase family protein [Phaeobacter sp. CECT 5382]